MPEIAFEENYVDVKFIKRVLGFESVRRVQQLTQDGVLNTCEVKVGGRKASRYDLFPSVISYIKYLKARLRRHKVILKNKRLSRRCRQRLISKVQKQKWRK